MTWARAGELEGAFALAERIQQDQAVVVWVIGDTVARFMAPPDTDPAALRAADSLAILPDDAAAAAEELQRRREEIGFSYVVVGAAFADAVDLGRLEQRVDEEIRFREIRVGPDRQPDDDQFSRRVDPQQRPTAAGMKKRGA
jgi:hypothetical protein